MEKKLSEIYYSSQGYWKGYTAVEKLVEHAKVSEDLAREWLEKQALWQSIYNHQNISLEHIGLWMYQTTFIKEIYCL